MRELKVAKYEMQKPSTCRATLFQNHLLRVKEMQRVDWLICQSTSKFLTRQVVSLMKNEQQSQNLLLKVEPRSNFRNNFLQPATNVFVARQVDHAK